MKNYAYKLAGEIGVRLLSTIFLLVLARTVGAADFGVYSTAFAFAAVFGIIVDLGTNPFITREIARYPQKRSQIIASVNFLKIITSLAMMACVGIATWLLQWPEEKMQLIHWFSWVVVATAFTEYLGAIFTGLEQMGMEALLKVIGKGVVVAAALTALLFTKEMEFTVKIMAVFSIASIALCAFLARYQLGTFGFRPDGPYLRELLRRSLPIGGALGFLILYGSQSILILNYFKVADHDIGLFAGGMKIIDVLKVLPVLLASTFFPSLARHAQISKAIFYERGRELMGYAVLGFPVLTAICYLLAPSIIHLLYGPGYSDAVHPLRILLIGFLIMSFNLILLYILISLDREKEALLSSAVLCVSNLAANLIFVPSWGILGCAYALVLSEVVYLITQSVLVTKAYTSWTQEEILLQPLPGNRPMMCSIIIPTYNTCELTLSCLARIKKYPPPGDYEVILVDNNSTDGTYEQVCERFPEVIALRNPGNLGFARACNRGAQGARGDLFLFLNSDTEPLEDTFARLLGWMKAHPKTAVVGPELIGSGQNLLQMSWSWYPLLGGEFLHRYFAPQNIGPSKLKQSLIRYLQRKPRTVPFICGACLMIRRDVFESLNGFDENFELYFEDADLCWRCAEAGWNVDFVPDSKIVHHIGKSTKGTWNMSSLIYQQSHITYYRKHAPGWSVFFLKCYLLLKWLRIWLNSRMEQKDRSRARTYCRSYLRVIFESMRFALDSKMAPWTSKGSRGKVPLTWNRWIQILSRVALTRRGLFKNFLLPHFEIHEALFGHYRFHMDLSLGWLQKIYFLKPDVYEWETQEALRRWVRPGMTVLDIGAHIGYMTLLLADLVGPQGRVYAFEPASRIFSLLKTNVESNHLTQVRLFQMALLDRATTVPLYINPVNDGNNSLGSMKDNPDFVGVNPEDHQEKVSTDTLDHFLQSRGIRHVDLIKIDVEGAEPLVFGGARELLSRPDAPPIICEVGDINQPYFGQREEDLRKLLYSLGYRSFWIENFREFGPETPVHGLRNVLFSKTFNYGSASGNQTVTAEGGARR
jgi:FkbM family methyltransferase